MGDEEGQSGIATSGDYDVFLSFRGPDTRHGFTDCLYEFMCDKGIRVFRDDEELRPGEKISEILRAIERSMLYIPIFSKDYASSKWCLKELACMVDCTGQPTGKEILPVFYDVNPSDVKLKTELYRSALRKHKDQGCTLVKSWEEALTTVAEIRGWHLKDKGYGAVIKEINKEVLSKIRTTKRNLPTVLVGINDRIEALKKLLYCDISDVRFVIIHGIGGIGKTTLAKAVFNQLSPQFESHSFLSRESSLGGGVEAMQRKLAGDLFSFALRDTFDFEEGNNIIKQRLHNKRVLLVFDGLDENDQFMQLAKQCLLCGPGSRVIVTTRDKSVFPVTKVEGLEENISTQLKNVFLYEMKEMDFDHALQLFNKLAFNTNAAPRDLYDLSREVVELTGGLPLAVEVIGSDLRGQSRAKRIRTLKRLKEVPREEVQQRLKISYDGLPYRAKQIYLDIACFFANKKKTNLVYMWEDSGFFPEDEIEILLNKSLIKIVDHGRIWMHDQLRALGREIIREENTRRPEDRSRLWFLETAHVMGTERAVALRPRRSGHNFTCKDFANLTNARFLKLDGGNLAGDFEDDLEELRYLWWRNCPRQLQAKSFMLNRLVVLKLSGDITAEEWSGWTEIMVASRLKVLKIEGSKSLKKTPCFSKFTSLERLVLKDHVNLAEIDCSIGMLKRLICLKIKCCPRLRGLPKDIGYLTALRELILIQGFTVCYLPDSIGDLSLLSRLVMEDTGLVEVPDTIGGLANLEYLSLANSTSVNSLPDAVGELKMLTELDLSGTTMEELPHSIWNRLDLTLRMNSSNIRTQLMMEMPHLGGIGYYWDYPFDDYCNTRLEADSNGAPKTLYRGHPHKAWQRLRISYEALEYRAKQIFLDIARFFVDKKVTCAMYVWEACDLLPKVEIKILLQEGFFYFYNSGRVHMSDEVRCFADEIVHRENTRKPGDRSRSWLPDMALDIVQAKKGTENVEALTFGKLRHNYKVKREDYAYLRNARFLELDGHNFDGNFKIILLDLRWLSWRNCPPKLQANNFVLSNIVVLKLSGDVTIEEWNRWVEVMVASKLKVLNLGGSKSFIKTPCFSEFMSLERLILKDFPSLVEIDRSISKLERLIYLKIKCCPLLRELPQEIGCLTALRELILIQGYSVCYLPDSIGNLRLSRLTMEDTGLVELPDTIRGIGDLEYLCLANCRNLNSLSDAVGELKSLTKLDLSGTIIEELPPPLWDIQDLTLNIHGSRIETRVDRYNSLMPEIERYFVERLKGTSRDDSKPRVENRKKEHRKRSIFCMSIRDNPRELFIRKWRTFAAPGFHEHHLSAGCPPKILARVIFPHGDDDSSVDIAAEVPLSSTGIMSSSLPLWSFKNLIIMLVSWSERKSVSAWIHDFKRKDEALLSLEFCDHCMCITSEIRELSPSPPCLESFNRFPQLSIAVSMTLHEPRHSDQTGCQVDNLEISTKFSSPTCCSTNLLLEGPLSMEKLEAYIQMCNSWHEEAAQVRGLKSRISFKSCKSRRLRKTRGGRLRAKRKRNLTWLCLHNHLDKCLLMNMVAVCVGCCILCPFTKTKLEYCNYVLEEACTLLHSAPDVKQITHLAREFARDAKRFSGIIGIEKPKKEDYFQFFEHLYILLLRWYCRNRRRGHHHKTLDADFLDLPKWVEHPFLDERKKRDTSDLHRPRMSKIHGRERISHIWHRLRDKVYKHPRLIEHCHCKFWGRFGFHDGNHEELEHAFGGSSWLRWLTTFNFGHLLVIVCGIYFYLKFFQSH